MFKKQQKRRNTLQNKQERCFPKQINQSGLNRF